MVESAGMSVKDGRDRQVLATGVQGEANSFEANSDMLVEPVGEAAKNLQDLSQKSRECSLRLESMARAARRSIQREVDVDT
tara:strand:+ start:643 stop:885 length:243 start_codon:yes stop_codon:yes gene_type:complete